MMIDEIQLISSAFPLVGGGVIGFGVGYVIKKLMKLAFIGLGLVMLVLGYLEYKHWISVNCDVWR
ncbi:MAG: FUN14 domain-containing protein [Candidatus Nitrosopolaris sp.]